MPGDLILLKTFADPGEARIARATLEAYGIRAFLFDEGMGGNMFPSTALVSVRLMVSEDDAEEAAALLAPDPGQ